MLKAVLKEKMPQEILIDSCVLIAYYFGDDTFHKMSLEKIEYHINKGNILKIPYIVLTELVYFLKKKGLSKAQVKEIQKDVISIKNSRIIYKFSMEIYYKNLVDFIFDYGLKVQDHLISIYYLLEEVDDFETFDKDFKKAYKKFKLKKL